MNRLLLFAIYLVLHLLAPTPAASAETALGKGIQKGVASVEQPVVNTAIAAFSSQCAQLKKLFGVTYEQVEGEEPDLNQLSLKYISHDFNASININSVSEFLVAAPHLLEKRLVIYMHGFTDNPGGPSFKLISDAFYKKGMYNLLALDGSAFIGRLYLRSTTYVRFIGEKLGSALANMVKAGYDPQNLHVIGHSLGAQIVGFTGKEFSNLTGLKVGRITGLDPAGPCFSHVGDDMRLNSTDAEFLDVIHTDGAAFGLKNALGQVDFYPNGGLEQPNCTTPSCSHSRAWKMFAESILNEEAFPAVRCESWEAFTKGQCSNETSYMGFPVKPGTKGQFYLQTGADSPYGLGINGTIYKEASE